MQQVSQLYEDIVRKPHKFEVSVAIGQPGVLLTELSDKLLFGGMGILVGESSADGGYKMNMLRSLKTTRNLFADNKPGIGNAVASEIDIVMQRPLGEIERNSQLIPFVRAVDYDGNVSEWIQKGVFYLDTRSIDTDFYADDVINIHGYDGLLKAEKPYTDTPQTQSVKSVTQKITSQLGIGFSDDTMSLINANNYEVSIGTNFTCREVLGQLSAMYGANVTTDYNGNFQFVPLMSMPSETNLLMTEDFYLLMIGGDRIYV